MAARDSAQLPALKRVHAALRLTTERLAAEVATPRDSAPGWSSFEWRAARAAAAMHGISGLLATRLRWQGPPGWQTFMRDQFEHIACRHARIQQLLSQIDAELRARGLPGVALKGAALHARGLYLPGERPMGDVDLLVAPPAVSGAAAVLRALHFREDFRTFKHIVFVPEHGSPVGAFGEHADNDLKVELHERIVEQLPLRLTDITTQVFPEGARPGLNVYPSTAALMAHLLLHAASNLVDRSLRLIQLHDIARLAPRLTQPEWQHILSSNPWWAYPALALAERYYGALAPAAVIASLRACCPLILRFSSQRQAISDVSLSRLWVDAFPGIAWARSAGEVVSYIAVRVVPGAQVRYERKAQLSSDPSLAEGDWARLSQTRRMVRFLSSRTARPGPLYNVRAALAQQP